MMRLDTLQKIKKSFLEFPGVHKVNREIPEAKNTKKERNEGNEDSDEPNQM